MREFISGLTEREFQKRKVALIENGSWASVAGKIMKDRFENSKEITFMEPFIKILSVPDAECEKQLTILAENLCTF